MLADDLKQLLADVVTFYFQAHGCHWNVEGADFTEYHALFESIYEDVYSSIDPLAENIRKLDQYAPFSLKQFAEATGIDFKNVAPTAKNMAAYLLEANDQVIKQIGVTSSAAETAKEYGIANFLAERDDMHKKWRWQLRAARK
jgi:starvation-inducible DNA-binding protein